MNNIGDKIRHIRIEKGMTQDDLAKAIGTTTTAISRYELGTREPRYARLQSIADVLEVPVEQLTASGPDHAESNENCPPVKPEDRKQQKQISALLASFLSLSEKGQAEAVKRVTEMTQLSEYRKMQSIHSLSEALLLYAAHKTGVVYRVQEEKMEEESFPNCEPFGGEDTILTVQHITMEPATSTKGQWWHFWCYLSPVPEMVLEGIMSQHSPDSYRERITLVFVDQSNAETAGRIWERRYFDTDPEDIPSFTVLHVQEDKAGSWTIQEEYGFPLRTD